MTAQLCAVCVDRPATHPEVIDGRVYRVCLTCRGDAAPPAAPAPAHLTVPRIRVADVVAAVAALGTPTAGEVAAQLRLTGRRHRSRVYMALARVVAMGQVTATGTRAHRRYQVAADAPPVATRYLAGERNHKAKLSERDVVDIRAALRGGLGRTLVALRYRVSVRTVEAIQQGRRWAHLLDEQVAA